MNTDRELLELATKAAGLKLYEHVDNMIVTGSPETKDVDYERWNPLSDDGDALRLAVKLGIPVFPSPGENDSDAQAATRRAIVRAAAEIGRSMP